MYKSPGFMVIHTTMGRLTSGDLLLRIGNVLAVLIPALLEEDKVIVSYLYKDTARQLYRSVTSIGANLREADMAISDREFRSKISIALKETEESRYRIELLREYFHRQLSPDVSLQLLEIAKILQSVMGKLNKK